MSEAKRILVLAATAEQSARLRDAAEKLALEVILGCADETGTLQLNFATRDSALHIVEYVHENPVVAIIPIGDVAAPAAARAASMIGISYHSPKAADACSDKKRLHARLHAASIETGDVTAITLECVMANGKLRLLASIRGNEVTALFSSEDQKKIVDILKNFVAKFGVKHGPVRLELSSEFTVVDVSLACPTEPTTDILRFRIPLVDQDLSYEEVIIRNALELDISRVHLDSK